MRRVWRAAGRRIALPGLALALLWLAVGAARAEVGATVRELVDNQRRILVLREAAGREERGEARRAGQYLFFANQHLIRELTREILDSPDVAARYDEMALAMDDATLAEEDRLVLRGPLEILAPRLPPEPRRDARRRLDGLAALRKQLGSDAGIALQQVPLRRGRPATGRWSAYLAGLAQTMTPRQILADLERELSADTEPAAEPSAAAARARVLEWNGEELPERMILLTFDDGPHPVHTPAILDILKAQGVHALFFQVGRNLGEVREGVATADRNREVEVRLLAEGHAVGNHSFTHPLLPKLDAAAVAREIADTQALIDIVAPEGSGRTASFRPPYGARNDKVLTQIDAHHLRSVVWNIDSEDWADPLPESIAHRVVREAESNGRGIVLMHDIHARSVEALPIVIGELKKRGFRFARWDGGKLVAETAATNPALR